MQNGFHYMSQILLLMCEVVGMIKELKKRFRDCKKNSDVNECDRILIDMLLYIIGNKWNFIINVIYPPFGRTSKDGVVVICEKAEDKGFSTLEGISVADIKNGKADLNEFSYKEKMSYISKTLPLIPIT